MKQVILWTLAFFVGLPTALILAICAWIYFANNWHPPKEFAQLFNEGQIIRRGEADAALTEILNKEFPLGTPVKSLKSALYRKGFRERPPPPPGCVSSFEQAEALGLRPPYAVCPDHRDMMEYNWSIGLVCGGNSYVQWTSDQNSLVTRIKGSADTGCL